MPRPTAPRPQGPGMPPTSNAVDGTTPEGIRRMGMIYSGGEPGPWFRVWVVGPGASTKSARFFFGLVRGTSEAAVKEARKRWPKQVGKMELEEYEPKYLKPVPISSKSTPGKPKAGGGTSGATTSSSARSVAKTKPTKRR